MVWQRLEAITEADVPESFRQGMADIAAGRRGHGGSSERAADQKPPVTHRFRAS